MRIKIVYTPESTRSYPDYEPVCFKIKINDGQPQEYVFGGPQTLYLDDAQINPFKVNTVQFRVAQPGKDEEDSLVGENVARGCIFAVMAIFLPFAFMSFKTKKTLSYTALPFEFSPDHDFVLFLSEKRYSCAFEPAEHVSGAENDDQAQQEQAGTDV